MERRAAAVRVVADVHERKSGVLDALSALGADVTVEARSIGDYSVSGECVVERKFILDFHLSVLQSRLWPQLWSLRNACASPFLLVEGQDLDDGPLSPAAVRGTILTAIEHGVPVLRSADINDSALWLYRLGARGHAEAHSGRPRLNSRRKRRNPARAAELLLTATPGISFVSARALLDHFGSVAAIASASAEELLTVPGIGSERARALEETLHASRRRSS